MDFGELLDKSSEMELEPEEIVKYCDDNKLSYVDFCNMILVHLAKNYLKGKCNYSYSDGVANNIHDFMMSGHYLNANNNSLADPAYSIYLAFDAGEYYRKEDDRSVEPHVKYTKAEIEQILRGIGNS